MPVHYLKLKVVRQSDYNTFSVRIIRLAQCLWVKNDLKSFTIIADQLLIYDQVASQETIEMFSA